MMSAATGHGFSRPDATASDFGSPCVGSGQTIGSPSQRMMM